MCLLMSDVREIPDSHQENLFSWSECGFRNSMQEDYHFHLFSILVCRNTMCPVTMDIVGNSLEVSTASAEINLFIMIQYLLCQTLSKVLELQNWVRLTSANPKEEDRKSQTPLYEKMQLTWGQWNQYGSKIEFAKLRDKFFKEKHVFFFW